MKDFENIPYHDELGERLFVRNRHEAGLFQVRIMDYEFSPHLFYSKNFGEHAKIKANNYPDQDYKRVFMYLDNRCPTWPEMVELAELFFNAGEVAIQFHPKATAYVNEKNTALHLWEPKKPEQLENMYAASKFIQAATEKLRQTQHHSGVAKGTENEKDYIAIFCGNNWATWEEVCEIKKAHFGTNTTAFQLNISKEFDLHPSKILTIWVADQFGIELPPADIV